MSRNPSLLFESLAEQFAQQLRAGFDPDVEQFAREHPELAERIRTLFPILQMMEQQQLAEMLDESELLEEELKQLNNIPSVDVSDLSIDDLGEDRCSSSSENSASDLDDLPQRIGRYRIEKVLGKGSFGLVYLAHDEQLNRRVAVKVPHANLIAKPEDAEAYLFEARTVANLDHPTIVPVHDVGGTDDFPCYIVSKYIEGTDLATKLNKHRLKYREAAELVATVAEALHYAHKQGIVHRDIKPSNILIGNDSQPFVVDFGLALREEDIGKGPKYAGTPMYMSPEQARGEGHRVDGRSDIFSLGIVFYELLAGRRPFRGETRAELLKRVTSYEARPLRQYDDNIPKELERICHKAMAKRASERYFIARDFAEDLRLFLQEESAIQSSKSLENATSSASAKHSARGISTPFGSITGSSSPRNLGSSDSPPIRIVPKGLRSFDAHDADFFLELLPGPRDREGLPASLRFWKTRIEETDGDNTFAVGLIYGPSGCGKSSLVKAGLLPRLSEDVIPVYVEATAKETESRLMHGLRKRCPALEDHLSFKDDPSLKDLLAALRRGQGTPNGTKVLIVLDQFEQWLHAKKDEQNRDLVQALRQCDGGRVQCIVMVRDDFWLAVSRFLSELEIRLMEGQNSALADLFDPDHARIVLAAFGRAFGKLPENINDTTMEQKAFLLQSVAGLAEEGKVICVRLALFAEMMKGKAWTPATLKEVGGTAGVGVTFLDETFSASTSPPQHRYHQKAARAVLKQLLPSSGTDIKGAMRSHSELLEASGYDSRPQDFEDLIRILDIEVRLITPTDPEGMENGEMRSGKENFRTESRPDSDSRQTSPAELQNSFFQLTHDYLVPSLREWLTRKQKETRQGRAELKLFDTSLTWNSIPESRFLPTWWDHLNIRLWTDKRKWTDSQGRMMDRAGRVHGLQASVALFVLLALIFLGAVVRTQIAKQQEATRIEGLVAQLITADPNQIPDIVSQLEESPKVARQLLAPLLTTPTETPDQQRALLHARLASVARDSLLVKDLQEELLTNNVTYLGPIRKLLKPYASQLKDDFGAVFRDETASSERRFAAALALADYIPETESEAWAKPELKFVAEHLVSSNAEFQPALRNLLRPIQRMLLPELEWIFGNSQATEAQRLSAANAIADYAASDLGRLSQLLAVATPEQYAVIYPLVAINTTAVVLADLSQIAATLPPDELGPVQRIPFGQRRANAAVTLLRLGEREKALPVFRWSDDPEALTQFIFRCKPRGIGVETLLDLLDFLATSPDPSLRDARYALILAIGEYRPNELPASRRVALVERLADWYANDPSSGVHGAAGWLLRHLGEEEIVTLVDQTPVRYSPEREWFTLAITVTPTPTPTKKSPAAEEAPIEGATKDGETDNTAETENRQASDTDPPENVHTDPKQTAELPTLPIPTKTLYYTFVVFQAGEYAIGSFVDEPDRPSYETRQWVTVTHPFALLDREITLEELIAFSPQYGGFMQQFGAQPADAGFGPNWYDSVGYGRWLGQQMGVSEAKQAYGNPDTLDQGRYPRDPSAAANWAPLNWPLELDQQGFRLPTSAEWEVACRAGARTSYGYGSDVGLLSRFGWSLESGVRKVQPTKLLRPSLRGLFDLHGNLNEWVHDYYGPWSVEPQTDPTGPETGSLRLLRGGSWSYDAAASRTANRSTGIPAGREAFTGFRMAVSLSNQ
jgi:eukaryotic-like serine/threonine-protein kinase